MKLTLLVTQGDDGADATLHLNDEAALAEALNRITSDARHRKSYAKAGLPTDLRDALRVLNDNPGPGFSFGSHTHVEHACLPLVPLADFLRVVEALRVMCEAADLTGDQHMMHCDHPLMVALAYARATLDSVAAFIPLAHRKEVA